MLADEPIDEAYNSDYDDEIRPMPSDPGELAMTVQILRDKIMYDRYGPAALNRLLQQTNCPLHGIAVCRCHACYRGKRFDPNAQEPDDLALWRFQWTTPPPPCILKRCLIDQCERLALKCREFNEDLPNQGDPEDAEEDAHLLLVTEDGQWDVWYADRFPHGKPGFQHHVYLPDVKALFAACGKPAEFFRHSDGTDYMARVVGRDGTPGRPRATHGDMIILHDSSEDDSDSNSTHEY